MFGDIVDGERAGPSFICPSLGLDFTFSVSLFLPFQADSLSQDLPNSLIQLGVTFCLFFFFFFPFLFSLSITSPSQFLFDFHFYFSFSRSSLDLLLFFPCSIKGISQINTKESTSRNGRSLKQRRGRRNRR